MQAGSCSSWWFLQTNQAHPKVLPNLDILTFIDQRYGKYLKDLGFIEQPTNGKKCFHRLHFKGNSGYKEGLAKIWDCGQTPWMLPYT